MCVEINNKIKQACIFTAVEEIAFCVLFLLWYIFLSVDDHFPLIHFCYGGGFFVFAVIINLFNFLWYYALKFVYLKMKRFIFK